MDWRQQRKSSESLIVFAMVTTFTIGMEKKTQGLTATFKTNSKQEIDSAP
jgi:hypothetical protein